MFQAGVRRAWYVFLMRSGGGMSVPGGRGTCNTRGRRVRPSCRGRVRSARGATGRCFLIGGAGTFVRQLRGS